MNPPLRRRGTLRILELKGSAALLVGANERRVALVLTPSNAGRYTITTESPAVIDRGLTLFSASGPLTLTRETVGDAIQRSWYVVAAADPTIVAFVETIADSSEGEG